MKIGIIGAGRLGICFALLCEQAGYDVLVSDIRKDYVDDLNQRKINTYEPEVEDLLRVSKNLRATTDNKQVIEECDLIYTLVATPSLDDGSYDVSSVWNVVNDFSDVKKKKYFVVGCTTNPGDCDQFKKNLPYNVKVLYNPEFIAQGSIVNDLKTSDIVLLGSDNEDEYIFREIRKLYEKIQTTRCVVCTMSSKSAEVVKIAINCFLTTKISFANMLGDVLEKAGCGDEIHSVLSTIGTDKRIGHRYLNWGVGYGGPCLPRDNRAFASFAESVGIKYNLGHVIDGFNEEHTINIADYWQNKNIHNLPFFFEYIAYKKGTDIITESQQYRLCLDLLDRGFKIYIQNDRRVTPQVINYLNDNYGDKVRFVDSLKNISEDIFIVNL
jgi:UDPglucose 6-dehydrogenase